MRENVWCFHTWFGKIGFLFFFLPSHPNWWCNLFTCRVTTTASVIEALSHIKQLNNSSMALILCSSFVTHSRCEWLRVYVKYRYYHCVLLMWKIRWYLNCVLNRRQWYISAMWHAQIQGMALCVDLCSISGNMVKNGKKEKTLICESLNIIITPIAWFIESCDIMPNILSHSVCLP